MKNLKDIIESDFSKLDIDYYRRTLLADMNEFFNNEIPENIIKEFEQNNYVDYVWENLQSHDYKLLQHKIEQYFGDRVVKYINQDDKSGIFAIHVNDEYLYRDKKFNNLLKFFNFFIRERNGFRYVIEPIYSQDMNDWVYKQCNGVVYHFTDNETANKILKTGLRIKGRTSSDFAYPNRIYLYTPGMYLTSSNKDKWIQFANLIVDPFMINKFGLAVLKIDLSRIKRTNITFYRDTAMGETSVFTYNNIPKECITKLNI